MDSKTRDILERFAQRLIDNNARSRTYFVGQLRATDTIDLSVYTKTFNPNIHLSNAILKKQKIVYPYVAITPNKLKSYFSEYLGKMNLSMDDLNSLNKENLDREKFFKDINKTIDGITDKDFQSIYNCFIKNENYDLDTTIINICDKYNEVARNRYMDLDVLKESAKQLEKETARSELYIGYPFIEGTFFSGKTFRAPLLLYSVDIDSTPNLKTIKFNGEVYINPVFMISYVVENKMPHQRFDFDLSDSKDILKTTMKYLKDKLALQIDLNNINKIVPFINCRKVTYEEKYRLYPGEYKITNNAMIGIFPISSKSIYYDIKSIIECNDCNMLLKNFLSKRQKDTPIEEYFGQNEETETKEDKIEVIESNDISQKMIIRDSMYQNLVIQGPPGTGKSQTIVNIIVSNVAKSKSVLVVSEKKTAIDVIYNRLDRLAKFALIVRNIDTEKNNFYKQLIDTLEAIKLITPDVDKKRNKLYSKNKAINNFFFHINCYANIINTNYDGFSFDEIAKYQKVSLDKELMNKIKTLSSNYESFHNVINRVYDSDYLEGYYHLKEELDTYQTYGLLHYDLNLIEKIKKIFTLHISVKAKKYLFNRAYYGLPIMDFNIPSWVGIKGFRLNKDIKEYFNIIQKEILKLDLDIFKVGDTLYTDAKLLDFVSNNQFSKEDITSYYAKCLYDDVLKNNKDIFKFISNYDAEDKAVTDAILEKEDICLDDVLGRIVGKILKESTTNRDVFEGIKELERLANLQRKKSIPYVTEKNFNSLKTMYPIWLVTPDVASSILPVQADLFDLVVFDEASQMFVENATGVLFRAKRAVVAGDTKQLRPLSLFSTRYVEDENVLDSDKMEKVNIAALEEESLLDYAAHKYIQRSLRYHYRSEHKSLIEFSASAFYQNKLFFASALHPTFSKPLEVVQVAQGLWKNNTNLEEAKVVKDKIIEVLKNKDKNDTVGIITFNEQQRKLISDLINKELATNEDEEVRRLLRVELSRIDEETLEDTSMFIKNIENVQGDERDIIVFSITYAKNQDGVLNANFGLLSMANGENRLNVAITRAKKKIIIIKSFYSYELSINENNPGPYFFKKYLEYVEYVNADKNEEKHLLLKQLYHVDDENQSYLLTDFITDLKEKIIKKLSNDYEVVDNYEVGSFVFDLAIKNKKKNEICLCIKTDNSLLSASTFDHENDYYCDKYLISRGWRFIRIFSQVYWKNPNAEIKKIAEIINK